MINFDETVYKTVLHTLGRIMYQADMNSVRLREVISLVILRDLYEWSIDRNMSDCIIKDMKSKLTSYIIHHPYFKTVHLKNNYYTNVNIPQEFASYQRVYDDPKTVIITNVNPTTDNKWEPDPTCQIKVYYFSGDIHEKDITKLTVCEKMGVYINRETGQVWYLDTNGNWKQAESQGLTEDQVIKLISQYQLGQLNAAFDTDSLNLSITNGTGPAEISIATDEDLNDMLK